jgi:molecular chaperone GrpE
MKDEKKKMTNLQDNVVDLSENAAKNNKVSVETEREKKNDSGKTREGENAGKEEQADKWFVADEKSEMEKEKADVDERADSSCEEKYAALNDSYLRLMAEYDNFRKRTIREKADLIKSGGANALTNLLPVIDDFERALDSLQTTDDIHAVIEGIKLIYDKFISYLTQQGVTVINAVGQPFDTALFEAIATIPAPEEDKKGKVLDCVQTGYKLYDKVLRHAKVVVGG